MPITVKITGLGSKFENDQKAFLTILANAQIEAMAKETETAIQRNITESIQRPGSTGNLASQFFAEKISNLSWGVGNISVLNAQAPYWKWINYGVAGTGRTVPPASIGAFTPGSAAPSQGAFRQGRFFQDSSANGGFLMIPTKPIEAHNYIEKTLAQLPSIIHLVLSKAR